MFLTMGKKEANWRKKTKQKEKANYRKNERSEGTNELLMGRTHLGPVGRSFSEMEARCRTSSSEEHPEKQCTEHNPY